MRWQGLVLLITMGTLSTADVYLRQRVNLPGAWKRAYHTEMHFQNAEGELEIYHAMDSLPVIGSTLRERHGEDLVWAPGEVMAWAITIEDGWLYRYLVQPLPDGGYWITCYRQPLRKAGKPGELPDQHRLKDLPVLPQSQPVHYSHNVDTKVTLEISSTTSSPEGALETLSDIIAADGWTPSPLNTGGFQIYMKGEKVALISAERGKDGITRILRLHKPLGVK